MFLLIELLGVFTIVFIVIIVLVAFIINNSSWETRSILANEKLLEIERERLAIANRRFMTGKIKKEVFEDIKLELEENIFGYELEIFKLKKLKTLTIEDKLEAIVSKITHPTKHRRIQIAHLLTETELIRKEIGYLEANFMKRKLSEKLFKKLVKEKEQEMISFENDIIRIVKKANEEN
jgi:hypothetical protein